MWWRLGGLLSGPLIVLAFPGAALSPLALVALLPLLWAIRDLTWGKRLLLGLGVGFVAHLVIYYSIAELLQTMSHLSAPIAWLMHIGLSVYHGLLWGLFALGAEPLRRAAPRAGWLTLPTLAVVLDMLFPQLFPTPLGAAVTPILPLAQVMDLLGVHGMTWLCLAFQVCVLEIILRARSERRLHRAAAVGIAIGTVAVLGYGLVRLQVVRGASPGKAIRYAMVQPNFTAEQRNSTQAEAMAALGRSVLAQLRSLEPGKHDLVLLPEGSFPFPYLSGPVSKEVRDSLPTFRFADGFAAQAKRLRAHLIFGTHRFDSAKSPPHNSLIQIGPDGNVRRHYDKVRLVPFGERMPFAWLRRLVPRFENLEPGNDRSPLIVGEHRLAPTICYEAIFPADVRATMTDAVRVVLNATNDVWFGVHTNAPALHLSLQRPRAIEMRVALVRAANTGITAVVNPDGTMTAPTEPGTKTIVKGTIAPAPLFSLYRLIGDWWVLAPLAAALLLVASALRGRRKPKGKRRG